jgi:hypothetical protein
MRTFPLQREPLLFQREIILLQREMPSTSITLLPLTVSLEQLATVPHPTQRQ